MRLRDVDELIQEFEKLKTDGNTEYTEGINTGINRCTVLAFNSSIVDAVPVVRCKDCKYLDIINKASVYAYCSKSNYIFHLFEEDTREHFCSWGERRENAKID